MPIEQRAYEFPIVEGRLDANRPGDGSRYHACLAGGSSVDFRGWVR
jgi:hypothetical protein